MNCKRAQAAVEYLLVTAFVLVVVAIIFAFAFTGYDQSVKISKTNSALATIARAADEVYLLGEGNTRFFDVSFPAGMQKIDVVNMCGDGTQPACDRGNEVACGCGGHGDINSSAIRITVTLAGGETAVIRPCRAKILLTDFPPAGEATGGPAYTIRVSWTETGKVELKKV